MRSLLIYLLQMLVCSGILYGYYHFFLRNTKFHMYNRYYLLAASALSILIPFFNIPVYFTEAESESSLVLQTLKTIYYSATTDDVVVPASTENSINWIAILYTVYASVALILLTRIIISLKKIICIIKTNQREKLDGIQFINTSEPDAPYSFFKWLFWNKNIELGSEKGQQIFRHEVFHIRQKHSWDVIFMEVTNMIFWVNPFFYLIKKELRAIHEFLADKFAINEEDKWNYAELLLMQALQTKQRFVNPFFHNQIKRRIAMITNSKKTSYRYLRKMLVLPIGAIITLGLAFTYKNKESIKIKAGDPVTEAKADTATPWKDLHVSGEIHMTGDTISKTVNGFLRGVSYKDKNDKFVSLPADIPFTIYGDLKKDTSKPIKENILFIIDGEKHPEIKSMKDIDEKIRASDIESITVWKEPYSIKKFGETGRTGVIEIKTKNKLTPSQVTTENTEEDKIKIRPVKQDPSAQQLQEVVVVGYDTEGAFPGGEREWRKYLERNLDASIPINNKAPIGTYHVVVQFVVNADGSLSDVKGLTNHGYGMEEEAVRIIKKGPKWHPTIQDGNPVNSYKKQPVTFLLTSTSEVKNSMLKEVVVTGFQKDKGAYTNLPKDAKPPSFVGGETEWRKHLQKNVNSLVPSNNGAPVGSYTTKTQFLVNVDGTISEIKSLTKMGYGMEEEALRVIQTATQWEPAVVNGKKVSAYKTQSITFVLADDGPDESSLTKTNADQLSPIYPNPSNNFVTIPFNSQLTGKGEIRITDINGNSKMTTPTSFAKGANNLRVNVASLAKGMYVVNVIDASKKIVRVYKMVKQ